MSRRAKGSGFKMRSSNKTSFKMMGSSSPAKEVDYAANIAAANQPRRHDSVADAMAYINSPQYNIDRLGEERGTGENRMWRDAAGNWAGMKITKGSGGKVTYAAPEFARLQSALPEDVEGAWGTNIPGMTREKWEKQSGRRKKGGNRRQKPRAQAQAPDPLSNLSADDFWSQYSF